MGQFDELADRLTYRLRVDPELRMDISHELKAHLEDSAEEYRQAGYDEAEAVETAIKALGDETELSQQLWLANRGRMRVRQVVKWSARIFLIPLSIVMIVVGLSGFKSLMSIGHRITGWDGNDGSNIPATKCLSEEERFIFFGDPSKKTYLEKQKSIADRWPENPVYYANYVNNVLSKLNLMEDSPGQYRDSSKVLEVLPILIRGQQLEPENGFYDITKAAILINTSCTLKEDPDLTFITRRADGEKQTKTCHRITVTNQDRFKQGLDEFHKGVGKPIYNSHSLDMSKVRLGLLPPVEDFVDSMSRTAYSTRGLFPDFTFDRQMVRALCAYSLELAQKGKKQEAEDLLRATSMFGSKSGSNSETLIGLLVGEAIYQMPFAYGIYVYKFLDLPVEIEKSKQKMRAEQNFLDSLRNPPEQEKKSREQLREMYAGTMDRVLLPSTMGERMWNFGPGRQMDYILYERIGTLIIFVVLVGLSLIFVMITGINLLRLRKDKEGPKLLFVGWRALVKICLLGVVLPIVVYAIYLYGLPAAGKYSWMYAQARLGLEFVLLGESILVLTLTLSYSAIRRRAMEAGMIVPPVITIRKRRWSLLLAAIAIVEVVGFVIYWYLTAEQFAPENNEIPFMFGVLIVLFLIGWLIRELVYLVRLPREYAHFRRTFFRSIVPILSLVVIVSSLCLGYPLRMKERQVARELPVFGLYDEVGKSDFRLLREHLKQRYQDLKRSAIE